MSTPDCQRLSSRGGAAQVAAIKQAARPSGIMHALYVERYRMCGSSCVSLRRPVELIAWRDIRRASSEVRSSTGSKV